jgi:hypothetical protein
MARLASTKATFRGADEELILSQNEPDRDLVGIPGLASKMGQPRGLLFGYQPQSRKFGRFHKACCL